MREEDRRAVCFDCERDITEELLRHEVCLARIIELDEDEDEPVTDDTRLAIFCIQCGRARGNRVVAECIAAIEAEEIQ